MAYLPTSRANARLREHFYDPLFPFPVMNKYESLSSISSQALALICTTFIAREPKKEGKKRWKKNTRNVPVERGKKSIEEYDKLAAMSPNDS